MSSFHHYVVAFDLLGSFIFTSRQTSIICLYNILCHFNITTCYIDSINSWDDFFGHILINFHFLIFCFLIFRKVGLCSRSLLGHLAPPFAGIELNSGKIVVSHHNDLTRLSCDYFYLLLTTKQPHKLMIMLSARKLV